MTIDGQILITGATGTLGQVVARQLRDAGQPVRLLSRRPRPADAEAELDWAVSDLASGAGLDAALDGATVVIHCASDPRTAGADLEAATRLVKAAQGGRPHLVYVSIVGVDRIPLRYYTEKLAVEQLIERSGVPCTILRATQFHELLLGLMQRLVRLPIVTVPAGTSFQPVDVAEVAARLIRLARGLPVGRAPDLGGPQVRSAADLARTYLRIRGQRRPVVAVRMPGAIARAYRDGGQLAPEHQGSGRTWDEFLADTRVGGEPGAAPGPDEGAAA
jgi:uncharacterized protein YbjT (DUF2867 family)